MDKLTMAHEYAKIYLKQWCEGNIDFNDVEHLSDAAYLLADAMQAEADKREPKGFPSALLTKKPNGECAHFHTTLNRTECFDCGEKLNMDDKRNQPLTRGFMDDKAMQKYVDLTTPKVIVEAERTNVLKEDWQPDWSVAPEWANWWAFDLDNTQAHWYEVEPIAFAIAWSRRTRTCKQAPTFNYQGDWKDSLRKRQDD